MKHLTLPLLLVCRQQPWRTGHFSISRRLLNKRAVAYCCYDRHSDGMQEIGTFHGDDLAGLTKKVLVCSNRNKPLIIMLLSANIMAIKY